MNTTNTSTAIHPDDPISRRIGEWQKRLLQLDRRNNLLYFKPGRSAVGILDVSPDSLQRRLERSRKGLAFTYAESPRRKRTDVDQVPASPDATAAVEGPRIVEGELRTDCEPLDLQRRLRNLWRRDREWHEEQGLNILFLAAGFLEWVDSDGDVARAPLLLFPCDLERATPVDPFYLHLEDDDPVVNPTLRHQLAEFGIDLPEFDDHSNDDGASVQAYIDGVGGLVGHRPGWSVDSKLVLSGFTFSKLAMYQDLARMREHGIQSELTLQLAGGEVSESRSGLSSAMPPASELAGGRLDELLDVRDQHSVLPADFSQLLAIQQARSGANLVIHGPPGTGKSQTIANLIATLLADGKRVLFVSEKMAALDVVKRRLEQCGLGMFCLDLHSDRGRKQEVYDQLRKALADDRQPVAGSIALDELSERRYQLNRIVQLLHQRRDPLELSVYEVQGRYAPLQLLPRCEDLDVPGASGLDQEWLRETVRRAERIARRPEEFRSQDTSRWLSLRIPRESLQLADLIREDLATVKPAIAALRDVAAPHADWLGLSEVSSAGDVDRVIRLLELLQLAPTVPDAWLDLGVVSRLRRLTDAQADQQSRRRQLEQRLSEWFGDDLPVLDYQALASATELTSPEQQALSAAIGLEWGRAVGASPTTVVQQADSFIEAIGALQDEAVSFTQLLGEEAPRTLAEIELASDVVSRLLQLEPVPAQWLDGGQAEALKGESTKAKALLDELSQAEERLHDRYSDALVDLVDDDMLIRYRTDHQSAWRRMFGGSYRRDQRILGGQMQIPGKLALSEALTAVEQALEVQNLRESWNDTSKELNEALGRRFAGRETDWECVSADLAAAQSLRDEWRWEPAVLRELLATEADGQRRRELAESLPHLSDAVEAFRQKGEAFGDGRLVSPHLDFGSVREELAQAVEPLRRLASSTQAIYDRLLKPIAHCSQLVDLIEYGVQLMSVTEEDERLVPGLATEFGPLFERETTDWAAVRQALDWTGQFLDAAGKPPSAVLRRHASKPQAVSEYARRERAARDAQQTFRESLSRLDVRFDRSLTAWRTWDAPAFEELGSWADDLTVHAGEAASWVEYREAAQALDEHLSSGATVALRARTERAGDIPGIILRHVYSSWLEQIYADEPELREFTRTDHEEMRSQFRRLDRELPKAARQRVRERVFARYPERNATRIQAGQLATLNGQLSRRRGQMSVRRLIGHIPNLLLTLKPCFLMSPLAVSQYLSGGLLESERIKFDTVIFDEASQVWPEGALPAIERARQVIVAGDRHQLPPSNFFRSAATDDDDAENDEDEVDDAFEGRESILDVMVGQLGRNVAESYLSVHYRSRCESLIRFSNHAFYEDRLLTFPGPTPDAACVRDVYLEDATYDAGGTRTNKVEAERVAHIVFDLMQTTPRTESIGVVALSRTQADLIENLIEERRMIERQLDDRFDEDRDEHFFVKNLENVQGDERDHMILSIGYGPTSTGAVRNNFGPINRIGGERRLNVAVTRARKSMTVVHSIRPEDITAQGVGASHLRRYLEYARNPVITPAVEVTDTGEPESPFEEAVLEALSNRGHQVESQVGVSGYRIDLAIRSADSNGFDLGIECDGATYHSSPTARDRDWLRQQVLEGLGWRIHRVWSTAWIRNPEAELAAIEDSLELARANPGDVSPAVEATATAPTQPEDAETYHDASRDEIAEHVAPTASPLFDEYKRYSHDEPARDPHAVPLDQLSRLIQRIVAAEQPVHVETVIERLRAALGVRRVGSNIRKRLETALTASLDVGQVNRDPDGFLRTFDGAAQTRPRRDASRRIERISDAELDVGLLTVARATFGAMPEDLLRETARQFGYRRTGADIAARLEHRIERLRQSGQLAEQSGMLVVSDRDD